MDSLSDAALDFFLMAFVKWEHVGGRVGASTPLLQELVRAGLLKKSYPNFGYERYGLTSAGWAFIRLGGHR
jgi:hypothetical protein